MEKKQIKLITSLLLGTLLLAGCMQSKQAQPAVGPNQTSSNTSAPSGDNYTEPVGGDNLLKVRLYSDNDIVKLYKRFNLTLNIDNGGESFEALIVYQFYAVNSTNVYSSTWDFENISQGELKRESSYGPYDKEGLYKFEVLVYDCSEIKKLGYSCYKGVELLYNNRSVFTSILVKNVTPSKSGEITIHIEGVGERECMQDSDCNKFRCENCARGSYVCRNCTSLTTVTWENGTKTYYCVEPNYFECVECLSSEDCKEGFKCEGKEKCIPDPYYCKNDSDCWPCEGCQDGKALCVNKICKYCDSQRGCKNGYICEDWGCTSAEVLKNKKNCTYGDICFIPTNTSGRSSRTLCTFSTNPLKSGKCLECWSDFFCKSGYHCYNYDCVLDKR